MPETVLTRNLRESFRLRRIEAFAWPAARAFLSMLVPLVVLLSIGHLDLVAGAVFGGLISVYCRDEPYRQQARSLTVVAVTMVLAVLAGDLIAVFGAGSALHEPLALVVTAVVGAVTTAVATAVKIGAPGGLIFTFATGACAHLALPASALGWHVLVTALSAAFAWAVSVLGARAAGLSPQRRVVAQALEGTAAHLVARPDLDSRHNAVVALEQAWHSVALVPDRLRGSPEHLELVRAVETCEALLAGREAAADKARAGDARADDVRAAARELRRRGRCDGLLAGGRTDPGERASPVVPAMPPSRWYVIRDVLRAAVRPGRHARGWLVPYAARVGLAALLSGVVANVLGIGHAYWAEVSAVSILQATSTATSVPRMVQRVSGTVFGVLIALGLLSAHPAPWVIIVLLAVLQWGAEMTVMVNYAFALLFATPVALLVAGLASPAEPGELVLSRLLATLLGAALAVAIAWLLPHRPWLARVRTALARVRELTGGEPVSSARLRRALVELHEAYEVAAGEVPRSQLPAEELRDLSNRAYDLLDRASSSGASSPGPMRVHAVR